MGGVVLVKVAGRFVRQQAIGAVDQRARNRCPLPLTAGKFARAVFQAFAKADGRQQLACLLMGFGWFVTANEQRHGDVFHRAEFGQQMVELVNEAHVAVAQTGAAAVAGAV